MSKSVLRLSACLLLAGAVVGTGLLLLYRDSAPVTQTELLSPMLTSEPALSVAESPAASGDSLGVDQAAGASSDQTPISGRQPSEFSVPATQDDFDNSPTTGVLSGHESDDPNAVIGRPFPISESISASCRGEGKGSPCMEVVELLAQLAEEPRDPRWATETEASLREWLSHSSEFTIRAIECRTSLCAVEVASLYGPLAGFKYGDSPHGKLFNWISMFGYEADPSSARVTVTVQMFKRR